MSSRRLRAAVLLMAAALASGCGSDAEAENAYVADVQQAQGAFVTRFDQTLKRLTPTSTAAQDRATLGRFQPIARRFTTTLARIQPPEAVRAQHRSLVVAIRRFEQQLARAEARLRSASGAARVAANTELTRSVDLAQAQVAKAIAGINAGLRD